MTQVLSEEELDELANTLATGHALNMFALVPTIERLLATIDAQCARIEKLEAVAKAAAELRKIDQAEDVEVERLKYVLDQINTALAALEPTL